LVKVDVEGAEWLVLEGAKGMMNRIRSWLIELHDPIRKREIERRMAQHGYQHIWIDDHHIMFQRI